MAAGAAPVSGLRRSLRAGRLPIDPVITVAIPEGWRVTAGGPDARPMVDATFAFTELTDDAIVTTVATRADERSADDLFATLLGPLPDRAHATIRRIDLPRHLRGRAAHVVDDLGSWFVAALVVAAPQGDPRATIGVEIVADGPDRALVTRLPMLRAIVGSLRVQDG